MLAKASMKLKNETAEKAGTLTPAQLAVLQVRAVNRNSNEIVHGEDFDR